MRERKRDYAGGWSPWRQRAIAIALPWVAHEYPYCTSWRHDRQGQRALLGARVRDCYDEQAKKRQKLSEGRGKKGVETVPHLNTGKARDQAGKAVGVSGKTIDKAGNWRIPPVPSRTQHRESRSCMRSPSSTVYRTQSRSSPSGACWGESYIRGQDSQSTGV